MILLHAYTHGGPRFIVSSEGIYAQCSLNRSFINWLSGKGTKQNIEKKNNNKPLFWFWTWNLNVQQGRFILRSWAWQYIQWVNALKIQTKCTSGVSVIITVVSTLPDSNKLHRYHEKQQETCLKIQIRISYKSCGSIIAQNVSIISPNVGFLFSC